MYKLIFTLVLIMPLMAGCYESIPVEENKSMNHEICSTHNNDDWLLTEAEARTALLKEQDKIEERSRIRKKLEEEAEEAERKWYREHGGPLPDSFYHDYYEPLRNDFWDRVREQEEIYVKYNMNFDEFFQEFVEIEYEYEITPIWGENMKYVYQFECDLKEGLYRTPAQEGNPDLVSYGRFIKGEDGEWTAIFVRQDGHIKPHGYPPGGRPGPPGGIPDGDRSPFGE